MLRNKYKKNLKLILNSFLNAGGVLVYITALNLLLTNGEKLLGKMNGLLGPVIILLLLVISASITGLLVFGKPIWMYLEGDKKDSLKQLFYTLAWLIIIVIVIMVIKIIVR